MTRRLPIVLSLAAATALLAAPAGGAGASSGDGPVASESAKLVRILGPTRKKAQRRVVFPIACSVDCRVFARVLTKTAQGNIGPAFLSGTIQGGRARRAVFTYNRAAVAAIRSNIRAAKMLVRVRATRISDGTSGIARRTLRFKR